MSFKRICFVYVALVVLLALKVSTLTIYEEDDDPSESLSHVHQSFGNLRRWLHAMDNIKSLLNFALNSMEFRTAINGSGGIALGVLGQNLGEISKYVAEYLHSKSVTLDLVALSLSHPGRRFCKCSYASSLKDYNRTSGLAWIVLLESHEILKKYANWEEELWNGRSQYIVLSFDEKKFGDGLVWYNSQDNEESLVSETLLYLWQKHGVYKMIISSAMENHQYFYHYAPFAVNGDKYGLIHRHSLTQTRRWYGDKLFHSMNDMNGYNLYVTVFKSMMMLLAKNETTGEVYDYRGVDAMAMKTICRSLNATCVINATTQFDGFDPFENGLRNLESELSDIVFTGYFTKSYASFQRFEFTMSPYEDKLCLITKSAGRVPKYLLPVIPFTWDLWLVLLLLHVVINTFWWLLSHCGDFDNNRAKRNKSNFSTKRRLFVIVESWQELQQLRRMGRVGRMNGDEERKKKSYVIKRRILLFLVELGNILTTTDFKNPKRTSQRAFVTGTLFFGMIIAGVYQSTLVSVITRPIYYKDMDTLEDIAKSNYTIITRYENLKRNTFTEDTDLGKRLQDRVELAQSRGADGKPLSTNDLVAQSKGKVAALNRFVSFKLDNMTKYYDEDGNKVLHMVKQCPATFPISYVTRLYSPYLGRVNELLLRFLETGLIDKWYTDMLVESERTNEMAVFKKDFSLRDKHVSLSLSHCYLIFLFYLMGIFLAGLVLLCEIYIGKRDSKKHC